MLGFERSDECRAQRKHHVPFQVLMLRLSDARAFLSALEAQLALVIALVQVAEAGLFVGSLEWSPDTIVRSNLRSIRQ